MDGMMKMAFCLARLHLQHADIGTTTIYARLLPQELQEIVTVFDA
jgi:site-specific recombinase XerD